ncbi:MAG: hypothetical protein RMI34_01670 [Chloroherpetonaceae bacterium]|nr:hypothetical protein [Chloroherpetonaceae bacterium]MCS7211759.1 hypothetical protein [Chloroherpetonaceae bacterium]MDW8018764.1 hypothetical protein [Chloroherpetonaceae bacterium]MDW8465956.1 hypothetical protein [Chloroherpetonaceae bacterium]
MKFLHLALLLWLATSSVLNAQIQSNLVQRVRPFITDDARVVGARLSQLESWYRQDKETVQQWFLFAFGPNEWLELTLGGVIGAGLVEAELEEFPFVDETTKGFSVGVPLVQTKFLFRGYEANGWPGVSLVIGTFLPYGHGVLQPPGYGAFSFLIVSQSIGEGDAVLIHGNLGMNYLNVEGRNELINTWGIGTQIRTIGGFHLVGELFSGDPYVPGSGVSYQVGFRHFFSDFFQIDGTIGSGIGGKTILPFWFSAGVRIVFDFFSASHSVSTGALRR